MAEKFSVIGVLDGWTKGDFPGNQEVQIVLNSHATTADGRIALTAQLATDGEVDHAVGELIKGLESARRRAKENIRKTNSRILSALKSAQGVPDERE